MYLIYFFRYSGKYSHVKHFDYVLLHFYIFFYSFETGLCRTHPWYVSLNLKDMCEFSQIDRTSACTVQSKLYGGYTYHDEGIQTCKWRKSTLNLIQIISDPWIFWRIIIISWYNKVKKKWLYIYISLKIKHKNVGIRFFWADNFVCSDIYIHCTGICIYLIFLGVF